MILIAHAFDAIKNGPSRCNQHRNGPNRRHTITMPTTTKQIPPLSEKDKARFWAKVDKRGDNECWPWTGHRKKFGHGAFRLSGGLATASRVAMALTGAEIPPGLFVCHRCDVPYCCNPSHLFLGTSLDNAQDRERKGRGNQLRGDAHPSRTMPETRPRGQEINTAILNPEKVTELRRLSSLGVNNAELGRRFGITKAAARLVVIRKNWKHVT